VTFWRWLCWWRPPFILRSVLLNLKTGEALSGVLWNARGPWFTLRQASALIAGAKPAPIDGEAVIHRDNVAFVQVLP
jgi:hypothetical protein